MFQIPTWENDVPKATDTFGKKPKKKKETEKLLNISNHENNVIKKNVVLNGIHKPTSNKIKNTKKKLKQISQDDKKGNVVNYSKATNCKVNGIKNEINKNENSKRIKKSIRNVEIVNTRKIVKAQVKKKRTNGILLTTHKEINCSNQSNKDVENGTSSNKKSKQILDNETSLAPSKSSIQSNFNKKEIKRKCNNENEMRKEQKADSSLEGQNINSDLLDEAIINVKKKKLSEAFEKDDREDLLFAETIQSKITIKNKKIKSISDNNVNGKTIIDKKKENIKKLLQTQGNRRSLNISGNKLRIRMLERLKAAQFRYLNEQLYTSSGSDAQKLFQSDPAAFQTYHEGYQQQLKKWPVNPLDFIVKRIQKMPKSYTIADLGCGEAALSKRIPHTVRSFDLVATAQGVEECDMAHTPLLAASIDVAVYCLALMGTDLTQYLIEANRILKTGGHLLIAEVESRFDKVEDFTKEVERLGFKLKNLDNNNNVFFFMEFTKIRDPPVKKSKLPMLTLKPCMYKKR